MSYLGKSSRIYYRRRKLTDKQRKYLGARGLLRRRPRIVILPPQVETEKIIRKEAITKMGVDEGLPTITHEETITKERAEPDRIRTEATTTKLGIERLRPTIIKQVKKVEEAPA